MKPLNTMELEQALAVPFDFYGQGKVFSEQPSEGIESTECVSENLVGIAFTIHSETKRWMLLTLERSLDLSLYSELGNTFASRLSTLLAKDEAPPVMISPPRLLDSAQLRTWLELLRGNPVQKKRFQHRTKDHTVILDLYLFTDIQTGVTHV